MAFDEDPPYLTGSNYRLLTAPHDIATAAPPPGDRDRKPALGWIALPSTRQQRHQASEHDLVKTTIPANVLPLRCCASIDSETSVQAYKPGQVYGIPIIGRWVYQHLRSCLRNLESCGPFFPRFYQLLWMASSGSCLSENASLSKLALAHLLPALNSENDRIANSVSILYLEGPREPRYLDQSGPLLALSCWTSYFRVSSRGFCTNNTVFDASR